MDHVQGHRLELTTEQALQGNGKTELLPPKDVRGDASPEGLAEDVLGRIPGTAVPPHFHVDGKAGREFDERVVQEGNPGLERHRHGDAVALVQKIVSQHGLRIAELHCVQWRGTACQSTFKRPLEPG